jgi:hypothetical protein
MDGFCGPQRYKLWNDLIVGWHYKGGGLEGKELDARIHRLKSIIRCVLVGAHATHV